MAQRIGPESVAPILLDLGKIKGKTLRQFKEGTGPLVGEIQQILVEIRQNLGPEAANKELVPIVIVYRKKRKRAGGGLFRC
ncbi:MAG TPA: hypothetical protein VMM92_02545 [Thermoanaerobaculia bacterium]|nr:hypothetical protein [Thermoanaerobaculia bacterium]